MKHSKRDLVSACLSALRIPEALTCLPAKSLLTVLNYHRIGKAADTPYASQLFSATAEEFEAQVRWLRERFQVVTLDEAIDIIARPPATPRPSVLITFDDGYLDNYQLAFPILAAHGVQGTFFLPTAFIGTGQIPWWDQIAFMIKRTARKKLRMANGSGYEFDLAHNDADWVTDKVLIQFKESGETSGSFVDWLESELDTPRPDGSTRCFLDWSEAAEMLRKGMAIGSHTHSHEILSTLPDDRQRHELAFSKETLEAHLGVRIRAVAYPVGLQNSFSPNTCLAAQAAAYDAGFSFYGGFNRAETTDRFNIRRLGVRAMKPRFKFQTALAVASGKYWF